MVASAAFCSAAEVSALLRLIRRISGTFGRRSQLFRLLFGGFGRPLCLTVHGHGIGHMCFEGGKVGVGLGELLPLLAQCEELMSGF